MKQTKRKIQKGKVLVALSGGVDSAVSAYLLVKQGYQVEGVFMKNWSDTAGLKLSDCPWLADRQDALRVAGFLRIPLQTLDFEKQYKKKVMQYFFREYKLGRTPNPDVMCNKEIKFGLLYDWSRKHGYDFLATGHYAQIHVARSSQHVSMLKRAKRSPLPTRLALGDPRRTTGYSLMRSKDEFKDQTYFIYNLKQKQLAHVFFPIGGMKKSQVKNLAKRIGLPNATRRESMGLCFVGKFQLQEFLKQKIKPKKGQIVLLANEKFERKNHKDNVILKVAQDPWIPGQAQNDRKVRKAGRRYDAGNGKVIGTHHGLHNFTLGQRQGIAVGQGGPYFVVKKNLRHNRLYVTTDPHDPLLERREVVVEDVHWIPNLALSPKPLALSARYRHQGKLIPVSLNKISGRKYRLTFTKPQHAVASGQSVVFYQGKECVGGGVVA